MNRHHSSWLLGCFGCYFFKSCRCWTWRGSDTHRIFSLFTFSGTLQVLKVSTNERTSWIGCVDEGDSVRMLSFENHFRDMFLNVSHIKYITFMHSFKAALITLLVTSWLNWPRHCMHIVYSRFDMKWYRLQRVAAHLCVYWRSCATSTVPFPRSFDSCLPLKWSWSARLKRLPFDVVIRTFCDWINALLVKRNSDRNSRAVDRLKFLIGLNHTLFMWSWVITHLSWI